MPEVNGKHFGYGPKGKKAAEKYAKKHGKTVKHKDNPGYYAEDNNMKSREEITREITTKRVRAGYPSKPVSDKEALAHSKRQRPIKKVTLADPPKPRIKLNSHTEYQRLGTVLAEAMGFRIDEFLPALAAGVGRVAAVAGRAAVGGAKALGKVGASGAKNLGRVGARGVDVAKKKAVAMAKEKADKMAKDKLAQKVQGRAGKVQAGPEGVATGDDEEQKEAELKAQAASNDDLEEGKIMNNYVKKLMEAHVADRNRKGTSDPTGFAYPIARKSGATRSSKAIIDPGARRGAKKAKAKMEKKLKLKAGSTKPQAQHMVQAHLNTRLAKRRKREKAAAKKKGNRDTTPSIFPPLDKKTQRVLDDDDRKKREGDR